MKKFIQPVIVSLLLIVVLSACGASSTGSGTATSAPKVTLNLGYFPNLTHAAALVGVQNGIYQKDLGSNVTIKTTTFNAGPAEITALLAKSIDIAFVGPAPAISGYTTSNGAALKVIAGAASAGTLFIVRSDENINNAADLAGKTLADPQKGGTQDVALRTYLASHGLKSTDAGGNVTITSTDNASILQLFKTGKIDGAWMPEPWATRLLTEGKGKIFVNESALWPNGQFATTIVVARTEFANAHPDIIKAFTQGVVDSVQWIKANHDKAATIANNAIKTITGSATAANELLTAWNHVDITYDPLVGSINTQAEHSYALGFTKTKPDLKQFYNLGPLNTVLKADNLPAVATS